MKEAEEEEEEEEVEGEEGEEEEVVEVVFEVWPGSPETSVAREAPQSTQHASEHLSTNPSLFNNMFHAHKFNKLRGPFLLLKFLPEFGFYLSSEW